MKIISHIDGCMKWPLKVARPLNSWISASSKLIVMGDAAHAMLPYMSQGAAMAVEDGAALATILNKISSNDEMVLALKSWEKERMKRSGDMQNASVINAMILGLPDGPKQRARDASMADEVAGEHFTHSANQWSDPATQWWAYGYDAEDSMEQAWVHYRAESVAPAPIA
jgi:salicylate hydroxylase